MHQFLSNVTQHVKNFYELILKPILFILQSELLKSPFQLYDTQPDHLILYKSLIHKRRLYPIHVLTL